nr:MucBP domain-containing protein [Lactococcus carnosus]
MNYVDEAGKQLLDPKTYEGVVGERINLETYRINISGYSFKGFDNAITEFTDKEHTVTLVYSKNEVKTTLTINYVDEAGKQLLDPKTYEGVVGERINLEIYEIKIDGYSFKKTTNAITEFTDTEQTVTLVYSKNEVKASLTINYVDEAGKQLLDPKTYDGVVGERIDLETYRINISGYSFKGFENKITELTEVEQTITLIYTVVMADAPSDDKRDEKRNKLPKEANADTSKPKKGPLKLVKLLPKTGESRSNGLTEGVFLTALVASLLMLLRTFGCFLL